MNTLFGSISEDKQKVASRLIEQVAFMRITLNILADDIKERGPTTYMINGKQEMFVENPSQKSYNTMVNRYTAACKALFNLLPKEEQVTDGFEEFLQRR